MTKSRVFLFVLLSFIVGVSARSFFEIDQNYFFLLLIFSLIFLFILYRNSFAVLVAFIALAFVFGGWLTDKEIAKTKNLIYVGETFNEKAVVEKVSRSTFGQNIIVRLASEKISILLQTSHYPQYAYGDLLQINCAVKSIENPSAAEAGRDPDFDYRMYMAKEGVLYQCDKIKMQKIQDNQGNWIYAKIISARTMLEARITRAVPAPYSALAIGLLLGGSDGLSKEIQADFSKIGMTHIVAVSGYNVTIIVEYLILLGITLGLWRKQAIWLAVVGIFLFVVMVGLPASAVRAGVMSGILLWAMKNGRLASSQNAVIFAAAIMLYLNPLLLRWDIGFQLSFLATLGIVLTASFWEKSFVKKNKAMGISEMMALSLSAQVFVLPIIAYNFHIASLISLLANILILPIVPLSMLLVFLVCIFSFIFTPLATIFSWLVFACLFYEIKLIHILAEFPLASVGIEKVGAWWIVSYYCILFVGIYLLKKHKNIMVEE